MAGRKVENKYGTKEWTLITIESSECWCCGAVTHTTHHHAIPQHLKPKQNVIAPVCYECHKKINEVDYRGMLGFLYKLSKQTKKLADNIMNSLRKKNGNKGAN
jgi:hypothetical protein